MTNDEGQLPNDAGEQSREAAAVSAQSATSSAEVLAEPRSPKVSRPRKRAEPSENPEKPNNVRRIRIELMLSKAEVARRANISVLTLDRHVVEQDWVLTQAVFERLARPAQATDDAPQ